MQWAIVAGHDFFFHTRKGSFSVNLLSAPKVPDLSLHSGKMLTVKMPNILLNATNSKDRYFCGVFDLKQLAPTGLDMDVKNHVAAVFREEDSSSLPYMVHHVILLWCEEGLHAHLEIMEQLMMPPGCTIWAGLGPGGRGWQLPAEAGLPFGGPGRTLLGLQVHHYSPSSTWGLRDSSGLSFLLADRLRPHDAGLLTVIGAGPWSGSLGLPDLPPGRAHYTAPQVLAPFSCTREWNAEELTVFSVYHHAHSLSISMSLEVVRGSQKVGSVRQEKRFDFDSQAFEMTSGSMKLRRGDELLLTCNEKKMSRTSPTKWGDLFDDEMCVISMTVYPAQVMSQVWFAEEGLVWCDGASHLWHNYSVSKISLLSSPPCMARGSLISSEALDLLDALAVNKTSLPPKFPKQLSQALSVASAVPVSLLLMTGLSLMLSPNPGAFDM
ncbi:moxd2 [Symbiodinium sp. CCMP2592]|nr:moxd2 [Symbiodinium sp. CCMP2592]